MVHFYHEITPEEIYDICRNHLDEIRLSNGLGKIRKRWMIGFKKIVQYFLVLVKNINEYHKRC
jgi:hypothetical protein